MAWSWYVILGVLVVYGVVLWGAYRHGRRRPAEDEGVCTYCGYSVRGLPSSICPECGSDLDVVGVRRASWWYRLRPGQRAWLMILVWTIGYAMAAWLAWVPFHERLQPGIFCAWDNCSLRVPEKDLRLWLERGVIRSCWPWEREEVMSSITHPTHWGICFTRMQYFFYFMSWDVGSQDWYEIYVGTSEYDKKLWQKDDDASWFFVLDDSIHYRYKEPHTGRLLRREGDHSEDLKHWVEYWADRAQVRDLYNLVNESMRVGMSAPFGQMDTLKYPLEKTDAFGRGSRWLQDTRWTWGYWLAIMFVYLIGLVIFMRKKNRNGTGEGVHDGKA